MMVLPPACDREGLLERRSAIVSPSELNVSIERPILWNLRKKLLPLVAGAVVLFAASACSTRPDPALVLKESSEPFVYNSLALSPVSATALGYHEHVAGGGEEGQAGTTIRLDELLDDYSPAGIAKRIDLCKQYRAQIAEQITMGSEILKSTARKIRKLHDNKILAGFAGSTADALSLFSRFEDKLQQYGGNLSRAAVELAKDWRTDKALRHLEALLLVADKKVSLIVRGTGDVIEPDEPIATVGSGGDA